MDGMIACIGNTMESAEHLLETIKELSKFSKSRYKMSSLSLNLSLDIYLSKINEQCGIKIEIWHNVHCIKI